MAQTGFTLPGCGVGWDTGPSRGVWTNVSQVTNDSGSASVNRDRGGFPFPSIAGFDYGFNIPTDATIDGIEVQVLYGYSSTVTGIYRASIATGFTAAWCNVNNQAGVEGALTFYSGVAGVPSGLQQGVVQTYGGATELWGKGSPAWTPAEINDESFGFAFGLSYNTSTSDPLAVHNHNYMKINVHYTEPSVTIPVDLQTVTASTQDATPAVTFPQNAEGVFTQPLDATLNEALEFTTDAATVNLTTQAAEFSEASFSKITNTPTVSITTNNATALEIDLEPITNTESITVSTFEPEFIPILTDGSQVDVSTFDPTFLVPLPQVLTLTSSVYRPVQITSRKVDLQFVEDDPAELTVIQTHGSPRVN